jgi:MYXO-CTERM domain-containing protein
LIGTLLYVPLLYGLGWLISRPLLWLTPQWRPDQVDLAGAVLALALLLASLPWRLRRAWGCREPWQRLGLVAPSGPAALKALIRGLTKALVLLTLVTLALLASGEARWIGGAGLSGAELLNALALVLGVGFAEELLFRGWLWGELQLRLAPAQALLAQALVFALVHPWSRAGWPGAVGLLGGLILLGVALGLQRRADGGLLWGAIGLHGGLVGGWFLLGQGLVQVSATAPSWLIGPANPIGGLLGWLGLGALLLVRRRWW